MWKLILLTALVAAPRWCRAAESCQWMNETTAAGILGGAVTSQVLHLTKDMPAAGTANAKSSAGPMNANPSAPNYVTTSTDDGGCFFARATDTTSSELRIEVRTVHQSHLGFASRLASCGNDQAPLRSIGNEAVACNAVENSGHASRPVSEEVVGRVRDRVFVVTITSNNGERDRSALRENATEAAKIVAGNLF